MDDEAGILYRGAFSLAIQLAEARRFDCQRGRHRNNPAADGDLGTIMAEVVRQLRIDDPGERELAREAVDDALSGRRPQW